MLPLGKTLFLCFVTFFIAFCIGEEEAERSFKIDYNQNSFVKDGKKFRYVSGSIHYFRSPEDRWDSLLKKMRQGGLNAITTYIPWNMHQPHSKSEFNYNGNLDVFKFLKLVQKNDLVAIVRPSPFIDAEWDMGGLPSWLLWEKPGIKLRTSDLDYNYFVSRWYDEILQKLTPFLYSNGGPIIMMQVENEYGSFGCDKNYTSFLRDLLRFNLGPDLVLFTNDGAGDGNMKCGSVPDVYPTLDFGPESAKQINETFFNLQRKYAPQGPFVNSEFYPGWLDHWQKPHSKVSSNVVATALDNILAVGANVNIYMFHGGTSFGYGAGANIDGKMYDPCPTSYDYDAPLTEAGDPTGKYFAIKNVISKYLTVPKENPVVAPKSAYGKVNLQLYTSIHSPEFLTIFGGRSIVSSSALSFEDLKIGSGFVLYQTLISFRTSDPMMLEIPQLKDRAYIYVDKEFVGILSRTESLFSTSLQIRMGQTLSILVENQGRPCFGSEIGESKGLGDKISLGGKALKNWTIFPLGEMDGRKLVKYSQGLKDRTIEIGDEFATIAKMSRGSGHFYVGNFTLPSKNEEEEEDEDVILDTFVRLDGFSKGLVWINGVNLGRYWPIVGPQETLYLPGSFLKPHPNTNTFILFELQRVPNACTSGGERDDQCFITLTDTPVIDAPTPYQGVANENERHFWKRT